MKPIKDEQFNAKTFILLDLIIVFQSEYFESEFQE